MHELSLLKDILGKMESISSENNNSKIARAVIKLGALSHISSSHFREHFYDAVKGTAAENAKLEIIESKDMNDSHAQDIILESVDLEE